MNIPRRCITEQRTPAELAIHEAMARVEEVGADVLLTEAVMLLDKAFNKVADYVDSHPGEFTP